MKSILSLLAEKHDDWLRIVISFGCNETTAQDIVQEMYIKIHRLTIKGGNFMYNETEVNHFYIFRTLRSMFIDLTRKQGRVTLISIDDEHLSDKEIKKYFKELQVSEYSEYDDIQKYSNEVNNELDALHWYDKKIYNHIQSGESIKSLSDKTKISYYSIYNTYTRVKKYLHNKILHNEVRRSSRKDI